MLEFRNPDVSTASSSSVHTVCCLVGLLEPLLGTYSRHLLPDHLERKTLPYALQLLSLLYGVFLREIRLLLYLQREVGAHVTPTHTPDKSYQ